MRGEKYEREKVVWNCCYGNCGIDGCFMFGILRAERRERYVDGLSLKNFKVIPRSCSTLTKWNLSGDLAVDSKNITVA